MEPIPSTAEIIVFRMLERPIDKRWTDWAYEMLRAGFDTENLVMLTGEFEPYNQFEVQRLADKVFVELCLTWDDRERVMHNYVDYLLSETLNGKREIRDVLQILKNVYVDEDELSVSDFAMLYWAYGDLDYGDVQYYWEGATRENIDEVTKAYFVEWLKRDKT